MNSCSWTGQWPWASQCSLLPLILPETSTAPRHWGSVSTHHPLISLTSGFLSLGEGLLEMTSH